jgi:hypothetical protein
MIQIRCLLIESQITELDIFPFRQESLKTALSNPFATCLYVANGYLKKLDVFNKIKSLIHTLYYHIENSWPRMPLFSHFYMNIVNYNAYCIA